MTKSEFVELMSSKSALNRQEAEKAVNAVLDALEDGLFSDGKAPLPRLGNLVVGERKERTVKHPQTGEPLTVPAGKTVRFRIHQAMRERLDNQG